MGINDLSTELVYNIKAYRDFAPGVGFNDLVVTFGARYANLKSKREFEVGVLLANLIMIS